MMSAKYNKDVLTTGEVARICNVAPRTVAKWFDRGELKGYRIPGSRDRRVPLKELIKFMRHHGIPLDQLETGQARVLFVDDDREWTREIEKLLEADGHYEVWVARCPVECGMLVVQHVPQVIVFNVAMEGIRPSSVSRLFLEKMELQSPKLIGYDVAMTEAQGQRLLQEGFQGYLKKPFEIKELIRAVSHVMA